MDHDQLRRAGYRQDDAEGVWLQGSSPAPFAYSDGDVEGWIYNQLETAQDLSTGSQELVDKIRDWPTLYHFSPQRADLLRPLAHCLQGDVLEVGAGCGAITRYLGETAQSVLAIEGSLRRANIARRRCRDLQNVEVLCANAMDVALQQKFDVVTLIGVLEYSKKFIDGPDPIGAMLRHCRSFLREDGLLIVAIENKLGLKYFAGAFEDHEGKPFYGIHVSYHHKESVTFGRLELADELTRAGYAGKRFYFPFPDYKLPQVTVTQEGASSREPVMHNLSSVFTAPDQSTPYRRTFSEQAAWPQLMANGLLGDLANSFLLVGRPKAFAEGDDVLLHPGDLAYVYSTRRPRQFHKENILRRQGDGVKVLRRRLYPQLEPRRGGLRQHVEHEQATLGHSLVRDLTFVINRPGWSADDLAHWAKPWVSAVETIQRQEGETVNEMPHVPGRYVDLAPQNLLRHHQTGALVPIDLEWDLGQPVPAHWVLFRGLMHTLGACHTVAPPARGTPLNLATLARDVLGRVGWALNEEEAMSLVHLESTVFGGTPQAYWRNHVQPRA